MEISKLRVRVVRSVRKTISLEIQTDGTVLLRAPQQMTDYEIQKFLKQKERWIEKHMTALKGDEPMLTVKEIDELADRALDEIPTRVEYYAKRLGVSYGKITIRNQRTRWGSCSSKKNLNFNCLLMLAPEKVLEYVVIHEVCHLLEMNHSEAFWKHVESLMPDYKIHRKWLKDHGDEIMRRMQ